MVFCVMLEGCFWTINELNLTNETQWTPRRYGALHFGSKHQAQQVARRICGSSHVVQFGPSESNGLGLGKEDQ